MEAEKEDLEPKRNQTDFLWFEMFPGDKKLNFNKIK